MDKNIWVVIPVYNNAKTIEAVVDGCLDYTDNIVVVDDGSTDADLIQLLADKDLVVLQHTSNMGKGQALLTALEYLKIIGADYMISIDGDGQHFAHDLPKFFDAISADKSTVYVGCRDFTVANIPSKSKFGRKFSNFWFYVETGKKCTDTQSGYRAYPVKYVSQIKLSGDFYDFEVEVLCRSVWAGLKVMDIPIDVHYPKAEERVSSFRPFKDNLRISLMHTRLVGRCLLPLPHRRLVDKKELFDKELLKKPKVLLLMLLKENSSPLGLASSAGVGTLLAILPFIATHTIVILYVTARLHLNKVMALAIQNLYAPPFLPLMCIELGYYMRHGKWLDFGIKEVNSQWFHFFLDWFKNNWHTLFYDWLLGSLILAPIFAVIAFVVVYIICLRLQHGDERLLNYEE